MSNDEKFAATTKKELQQKLRESANEMYVVSGVHSYLISVCKLADADYITGLSKHKANIYNVKITIIKKSKKLS